jgi:hypothetical protein
MKRDARTWVLTICGASKDGPQGLLWICGRAPGHDGPHKDVNYPVTWGHLEAVTT